MENYCLYLVVDCLKLEKHKHVIFSNHICHILKQPFVRMAVDLIASY